MYTTYHNIAINDECTIKKTYIFHAYKYKIVLMIRVPFKKFFKWRHLFGVSLNSKKRHPSSHSLGRKMRPGFVWPIATWRKTPTSVGFFDSFRKPRRRFGKERSSTCPSSRALCFHSSWKRWCVATWEEREDSAFFLGADAKSRSWEEKVDVCVKKC